MKVEYFVIIAGVVNFICAYLNQDWYFELAGGKSYIALKLLGRGGFRIFQLVMSIFLVVLGVLLLNGK